MKPKTKAQELGFLSRDYAVAKDKKNWVALFDEEDIEIPNGSTVFRGVYPGNNADLRAYTMVGDLDPPDARLAELAKIAGVD